MANGELFDFIMGRLSCVRNFRLHRAYCIFRNLIYSLGKTFSSSFVSFSCSWVESTKRRLPLTWLRRSAARREPRRCELAKYIFYLHVLKAGERRDFYWKLRFKRSFNLNMFSYFTTHLGMTPGLLPASSVKEDREEMKYRFGNSYNCSTLWNSGFRRGAESKGKYQNIYGRAMRFDIQQFINIKVKLRRRVAVDLLFNFPAWLMSKRIKFLKFISVCSAILCTRWENSVVGVEIHFMEFYGTHDKWSERVSTLDILRLTGV